MRPSERNEFAKSFHSRTSRATSRSRYKIRATRGFEKHPRNISPPLIATLGKFRYLIRYRRVFVIKKKYSTQPYCITGGEFLMEAISYLQITLEATSHALVEVMLESHPPSTVFSNNSKRNQFRICSIYYPHNSYKPIFIMLEQFETHQG